MSFFQLFQLFVVLESVLLHLSIFQLLFQGFGFAFEGLRLDIFAFGLTLFLFAHCLFSTSKHSYMASQSWLTSRSCPYVFVFTFLGEVRVPLGDNIFLAVFGRPDVVLIIIKQNIITRSSYVSWLVYEALCARTIWFYGPCSSCQFIMILVLIWSCP